MLSFEEKLAIADSFPELERRNVSLGRVNYHYEQSAYDKKTVIYHLHPNGNGYVYAGHMKRYDADEKGLVNIRQFTEEQFRTLIEQSIASLTASNTPRVEEVEEVQEERWSNALQHTLTLQLEPEDGMWYIYAGLELDSAFDTYEEAVEYLEEEGFSRQR
ncbi:hypothetical protein BVG16_18545 [Paenibacillus selenitireducens]|uniref:Uncharacterized protein n=1 Tax=Paenibacillus selenitireducens TaxID=1324314 RepID=A0A1T2X8J9_9BACL|nr:hypothetical protein [Paenibacillus selenitireducens]OPA76207.1 hypothetical protein BVG16_18545 [Paenibacillus selenitireducens]